MQSIKTKMDWHIQESLMIEVYTKDPENPILNKFMSMGNHHIKRTDIKQNILTVNYVKIQK